MDARRTIWSMILLLVWLPLMLAACTGGSGSSGFDAAPQSENAAINEALAQQRCVAHESLQVCPVGPLPAGATQQPPSHVNTGLDRAMSVTCTAGGDGICSFLLPFAPDGFPPTAAFRVAVRTVNPIGRWRITDTPLPTGTPSAPQFDVPVSVQATPSAPSPNEHVQVAILAFLQPPSSVPSEVEDLSDSGADFAFVTNELTLQLE